MTNHPDFQNKMDIELMKKDIHVLTSLSAKFDSTLDKLQEIASALSKMISIQELRLASQEEATKELFATLEARKMDHTSDIKDINNKIDNVNRELNQKIQSMEKKILEELKGVRNDMQTDDSKMKDRITSIEMWRYAITGIIAFIAFTIGSVSNILKIFGSN